MTDQTPDDLAQQDESREQLLREVVPHLEFAGVQFVELSARRRDYTAGEAQAPDVIGDLTEEDVTAMEVQARQDDEQFAVMVSGGVNTDAVHVKVTVVATFAKVQPIQLDGPAISVFIERVAIMAIYPFIRQAVHDMSSRMGAPATLHLLRAGQLLMSDEQYSREPAPEVEEPPTTS